MPFDAPGSPRFSIAELHDRLDALPACHPSSPRFPDRRAAADSRPFTDTEWARHLSEYRARLDEAIKAGRSTEQRHTIDPDNQQWTVERARAHRDIVSALYERARDVPNSYSAIMAGGLPGSGKSTVLASQAGIDRSQYLIINPDEIKQELASRDLLPRIDGMSPMETADLAHEESSLIAKQLAHRALSEGKNLIWDITMSSQPSTGKRIDDLRAAGYVRIEGIFVDIPIERSVNRADARHRSGESHYRMGNGPGGRYVAPEIIHSQADAEFGSLNRRTFEQVKHRFDDWSRYDNSVDGRPAQIVDSGGCQKRNLQEVTHT